MNKKTKFLKTVFLLVSILLAGTLTASAYDFEVNGIYYNKITYNGDSVSVTYATSSYNSYSGDIVIPATVEHNDMTYKVKQIGRSAFCNSIGLTSVVIPEGVTIICYNSFYGCTALTDVTIPESVTEIQDGYVSSSLIKGAFQNCKALVSITIPDGMKK